jgi:hypothetical protein
VVVVVVAVVVHVSQGVKIVVVAHAQGIVEEIVLELAEELVVLIVQVDVLGQVGELFIILFRCKFLYVL